jgi:diadenosine tetraphosphate (Ap4A) HIT family hydrolase
MFQLDPHLAADTFPVAESSLSLLSALDDARYPWLVLIPKRANACEWFDLEPDDQRTLFGEAMVTAQALGVRFSPTKLNLGQLGNIVRQLHVHIVARREGDPAWPGPVWGHSPRVPYAPRERADFLARLKGADLEAHFSFA